MLLNISLSSSTYFLSVIIVVVVVVVAVVALLLLLLTLLVIVLIVTFILFVIFTCSIETDLVNDCFLSMFVPLCAANCVLCVFQGKL